MAVNLASKYEKVLDQYFYHVSYTDAYVNKKYTFDGVKTVNVYTLTSQTPVDYNRALTGDRFGGHQEMQDVVTPYTLTNDKAFKIAIDKGNYEQSVFARNAGEALKIQMREQIVPMIDKDRLAAVSAGATAATQVVTSTAGAEYTATLNANVYLDEAQAPLEGRVLAVSPAFYMGIKSQITTTINASEYNTKLVGRGFVGELDGVPVVKIPTSYFPTGVKALIWHRDSLLGAKQIYSTRIKTDSELIDGALLIGRFIFGSFVLAGKAKGVAAIK